MTENSIKKHIDIQMRLKSTNELVDIWVKNNRTEWTNEAFEVVYEILSERLEVVPDQRKPNYEQVDYWGQDLKNFLKSTSFWTVWVFFIWCLVVLIGSNLIDGIFSNGEEAPFIYFNLLLVLTLPVMIASGLIMIKRREVARPGISSIKGWAAIATGLFVIAIAGLPELFLLFMLIQELFNFIK